MTEVPILTTEYIANGIKRFVVEKPHGYQYVPGQATEVALTQEEWRKRVRPFTFTSLPTDDTLEFMIKSYPDHDGVTVRLHRLSAKDSILIDKPFGAIHYQGPGTFIAGGTGITPFIAIFRMLAKEHKLDGNKLMYSNKRAEYIILEDQLRRWFPGDNLTLTLTQEKKDGYGWGRIEVNLLHSVISDRTQHTYVCGPSAMVRDITRMLQALEIPTQQVIIEE